MDSMYDEEIPDYLDRDEVIPVAKFCAWCESGGLIDYDGSGHPVKNGKMAGSVAIRPSRLDLIPRDATHIAWFNR